MNVLFVCKANVGRSQIAEAIFNQRAEGKHMARSAGVEARGSEGKDLDGMLLKDRASSEHAIECLKEAGIDVSGKFIKRLTPEMAEIADKIVVMVKPDAAPEFLKENGKVVYWDISDPDGRSLEYYRATRDEIKRMIEALLP